MGGGGVMYSPGWLGGEGQVGIGGMAVPPLAPLSKATPTPQEASSSSLEAKDPASLLPHCSSPCSPHTSCILLRTPTWAESRAALRKGPWRLHRRAARTSPSALAASSGLLGLGPVQVLKPGL